MRKGQKPYMLQMSEHEKAFIEEMAWRHKISIAQYVRGLIKQEMELNPEVTKVVYNRIEQG